jgi:pimeloyl-ACP methyl ester carboxylesterase
MSSFDPTMKGRRTMDTQSSRRVLRRPHVWLITVVAILGIAIVPVHFASAGADARERHHMNLKPTIVLVHGDWADGSSWNAVTKRLINRGYNVVVPPNPLRGPTEDSAYLRSFLETIQGPIVLAAHSYGGFVITNAAVGLTNVKALVYIDAFIPDEGDNLFGLVPGSCLGADPAKVFTQVPVAGGADLYLQIAPNDPYAGFAECFANGVDPETTALLAATQRPAFTNQASEVSGPPAWKTVPSRSLIGTEDHVVPPDAQEFMSKRANATIETVDAGHLSLISRPEAVTKMIEDAVAATS